MKSLRIEARLRNNVLWHAIFDKYATVAEFCRAHPSLGSHAQGQVGELLNLKGYPKICPRGGNRQAGASWGNDCLDWNPTVKKLCRIFKMCPEDLFPLNLYELPTTKAVFEIEPPMLPMGREVLMLEAPGRAEDIAMVNGLRSAVSKAFCRLSAKEEKILKMRFGIDGEPERTLEEVGQEFHVCKDRIRQIEAKALCKLRRPPCSKHLKPFLEDIR